MIKKLKITSYAFILFLFGFTLITWSTAFAWNGEDIYEGCKEFDTELEQITPLNFTYKFKVMKDKMICMREAVVKYKGPTSQPECAAINPGTTSDPKGKFNKMTDKMKCYEAFLPVEPSHDPVSVHATSDDIYYGQWDRNEPTGDEAGPLVNGNCVNRCLSEDPTEACTKKCRANFVPLAKLKQRIDERSGKNCLGTRAIDCLRNLGIEFEGSIYGPHNY